MPESEHSFFAEAILNIKNLSPNCPNGGIKKSEQVLHAQLHIGHWTVVSEGGAPRGVGKRPYFFTFLCTLLSAIHHSIFIYEPSNHWNIFGIEVQGKSCGAIESNTKILNQGHRSHFDRSLPQQCSCGPGNKWPHFRTDYSNRSRPAGGLAWLTWALSNVSQCNLYTN